MVQAYNYQLRYSDNCCRVYLNHVLLGTIDKGTGNNWYINIPITGDNFLLTKSGVINPSINIQDINAGHYLGNIKLPRIPFFFRKFTFIDKAGKELNWMGKGILSFHWLWKYKESTVVEAIEDITTTRGTGVLTLSSYLNESNLLIMTGIFLALRMKRKLSLGLHEVGTRFRKDT